MRVRAFGRVVRPVRELRGAHPSMLQSAPAELNRADPERRYTAPVSDHSGNVRTPAHGLQIRDDVIACPLTHSNKSRGKERAHADTSSYRTRSRARPARSGTTVSHPAAAAAERAGRPERAARDVARRRSRPGRLLHGGNARRNGALRRASRRVMPLDSKYASAAAAFRAGRLEPVALPPVG